MTKLRAQGHFDSAPFILSAKTLWREKHHLGRFRQEMRQPRTASKPVKLQRPGEGRRVQSLPIDEDMAADNHQRSLPPAS